MSQAGLQNQACWANNRTNTATHSTAQVVVLSLCCPSDLHFTSYRKSLLFIPYSKQIQRDVLFTDVNETA
jgi:hypothetical protein